MPLFQRSVLDSYLKLQDQTEIEKAYKKYTSYFHNTTIQKNIRESKEEQFQATFLTALFVKILGYTLNPQPKFNLTTELKNEGNSRKADGAILIDGNAVAVIELKGTNTKDLEKVRQQAFDYKANHSSCVYVITSNFEKLRFYINNAVDYEEFNLFNLTLSEFSLLYLCLAYENIKKNQPLKIKEASIRKEENITKDFYKDYSDFKRLLFRDLVKLNMKNETFRTELSLEDAERGQKNIKHKLFKKSQKLIDRFLFIFFAEDRGLLPPNSTAKILSNWDKLNDMDAHMPLYDRFKLYFNYLDTGRKGTDKKAEIFAYNGGLFKPDRTLDSLLISDQLLYDCTKKLSDYDFESEVDVNILGHIFENSLNEIESVNAEIEGNEFDKQTTKRKKDGVFYTPKYITKYIVDNTVGKLCQEKKAELGIIDEEFTDNRQKATKKKLLESLETYRNWLLQLTICDPACGSGAFLNQALNFLISEHEKLDELQTALLGGGFVFPEIENTILENNIFGVDLNEESVEIAKLSLWLRTAQPRRKLNDLSSNIKCGNSLINIKSIAGEKAFDWSLAFPKAFEKGGFDVIIGNPPYGAKLNKETQNYLNKSYIKGGSETVISFLKLSHDLLKAEGHLGFIIPKSFSYSSNYSPIREFLLNDIYEIVDCKKVWSEVKLEQVIVHFRKDISFKNYLSAVKNDQDIIPVGKINKNTFNEFGFLLNGISSEELELGIKIKTNHRALNDIAINQRGAPYQKFIVDEGNYLVLAGANIQREGVKDFRGYMNTLESEVDNKALINENSVLVQNIVSHVNNPVDHVKIIATRIKENAAKYLILDTINQISINNDNYSPIVISELLNSRLINWYCYRFIFGKAIRTMHFDNAVTSRIPIPEYSKEFEIIEETSLEKSNLEELIDKNRSLVSKYLKEKYSLSKEADKKISNWDNTDFKKLLSTIKKQSESIIDSSIEMEIFELFDNKVNELNSLKKEVVMKDSKINKLVFKMFELSEKEIEIINQQMP